MRVYVMFQQKKEKRVFVDMVGEGGGGSSIILSPSHLLILDEQ